MPHTTTIKNIAKELSVSPSTVSRALNNHPRISETMKQKIHDLAQSMNYERNNQAVFFQKQKTYTIGVILPNIKEEFFSDAINGIESAAALLDYTILFGQSYDDPETEKKVFQSMKKHRVDGIIISLSKNSTKLSCISDFEHCDIPIVYFDRVPEREDVNKVYCNMKKSTIELVRWLFSKDYKRIAIINGPLHLNASIERVEGYKVAHSDRKIKIDMRYVETCDLTEQSTHLAMSKLLSLKKLPEAIISFNDYVHMYATKFAHSKGVIINKDIVFVSYSNLSISGFISFPPLVSVEQFPQGQGEAAFNMMMKIIESKNMKTENSKFQYLNQEVKSNLVVHESARFHRF